MFRNWLQGNRDLYLIQSSDNGNSFTAAHKLGNNSWKLNGCPMDGGGLAVNDAGAVQTVWKRESKVFIAEPGMPETAIGEGKGCTIASVGGKNVYAWSEEGSVVVVQPNGQKKVLGKGALPILKALNNDHVICIWEKNKQIHASIVSL